MVVQDVSAQDKKDKLENSPYVKTITTEDMLEELKSDKDKQLLRMIRTYLSEDK
ncbi:MAG: hypothetical protein H6Q70_3164 [Firmicutes bacterium]|nr:hypothetical protein [Bacillota bacterium]